MSLELKQSLKMTQQLVMTPQLQQAIKLLQLSRLELVDLVRSEMKENPLLDGVDDGEDPLPVAGSSPAEQQGAQADPTEPSKTEEVKGTASANEIDWDLYLEQYQLQGHTAPSNRGLIDEDLLDHEASLTREADLSEHLLEQLRHCRWGERDEMVAALIIGNLDQNGYLSMPALDGDDDDSSARNPLIRISYESGVPIAECEEILGRVQGFDPPGIGARDLSECLLIQLRAQNADLPEIVEIAKRHLHQLETKNYSAIAKALKIPIDRVLRAVKVISRLDPKPGRAFSADSPRYITPDVVIHKLNNRYAVVVNDDGLSKLRISNVYRSRP